MPAYTFNKNKKVTNANLISQLFSKQAAAVFQFPLRISWVQPKTTQTELVTVLVTVSKKRFPKATQRNRIKRQLREVYRLNQFALNDFANQKGINLAVCIQFIGSTQTDYKLIEKAFLKLIPKIITECSRK